jgi:glycosyltransferase involved in cell wall biosynthesis
MLENLLRKTGQQECGGHFSVSVVVVDNDPEERARHVTERLRAELSMEIIYEAEAVHTIPAARNHSLECSHGDYVAIIDDDEFPPPDWLQTLYRGIRTFGVDGALGPVHPFFEQQPPRWLLRSGLCERPVHRTGTLLHWSQTRTGNFLMSKDAIDRHRLRFDETFTTGGSDRQFFKEAMRCGCRFVAVEEAPVFEVVPPQRWGKTYYVKRALVQGYNAHKVGRSELSAASRILVLAKSMAAALAYLIALPVCVILGPHVMMNCLIRGAHHASRVLANMGVEAVKRRDF